MDKKLQQNLERLAADAGVSAAWLYVQEQAEGLPRLAATVSRSPELPETAELVEQWRSCLDMVMGGEMPLGEMMSLARQQEESQQYATQTAFILLLANSLNDKRSQSEVVATIVEQSVQIFNSMGGILWLLGQNGRLLEPVTSLSVSIAHSQPRPRPADQGLIGQVITEGLPFCEVVTADHEAFDPEWDHLADADRYALLAVPLLHRNIVIGALAMYRPEEMPFTAQEQTLLQAAASIASAALSNMRMLQELRDYGEQQRILYEMSRQIAKGLELDNTLRRALGWMARLCSIEMGFLWLREGDWLTPAAALGFALRPEHQTPVSLQEAGLIGWSIQHNQLAHTSDLDRDPRSQKMMSRRFNIPVHNILSIPISYHDEIIGAIALVNKIGEPFDNADLTLLPMAAEMIAIAIGNARLHNQTLSLMVERERLHQQAIQQERLAVIGRLTASLSHEINNPMQAIRGALKLATEEMDDPQALQDYIQLSLDQSARVVQLIERLRSVYRPQTDKPEEIQLNNLLRNILLVTRKEMSRNRVEVQSELAADLPPIQTIAGQLQLVMLNLMLNLSDTIGSEGGGVMRFLSYQPNSAFVSIRLMADLSDVSAERWLSPPVASSPQQVTFDLLFSRQMVQALGGKIQLERPSPRFIITITLPLQGV